MKITVNEKNIIQLENIYNSIILKTSDGEEIYICMRDSGFEFKYEGVWYSAQNGDIKKMKISSSGNILVDQSDMRELVNTGQGNNK